MCGVYQIGYFSFVNNVRKFQVSVEIKVTEDISAKALSAILEVTMDKLEKEKMRDMTFQIVS